MFLFAETVVGRMIDIMAFFASMVTITIAMRAEVRVGIHREDERWRRIFLGRNVYGARV
jgi:hypothetical protein